MKYKIALFIPLLALLALLAACSGQNDANQDNFSGVVQTELDTIKNYCLGNQSYPSEAFSYADTYALLEAGFIKRIAYAKYGGQGDLYDLTDLGRSHHTQGGGFCPGKLKLLKIVNFTAPSEQSGMKISTVAYEYSLADMPNWTSGFKKVIIDELKKMGCAADPLKNHLSLKARSTWYLQTKAGLLTRTELNNG